MTGSLQAAARVQLGHRREPAGDDAAALVHRVPAAWDQLSIWAVTVGTNMGARDAAARPRRARSPSWLGVNARYDARALLTAGRLVGAATLLRFYVLHCIFIPIIAAVLMIVHFWRVRKDGGISGPL